MTTDLRPAKTSTARDAELRKVLEERRAELLNEVQDRVRRVRTRATSTDLMDVVDSAESAEADIQDELHFSLIQMKAEMLDRIQEAMSRIDAGRFGRCIDCDDEISERRLRALPFALRCKDCEQTHEQEVREAQNVARRQPGAMFDAR